MENSGVLAAKKMTPDSPQISSRLLHRPAFVLAITLLLTVAVAYISLRAVRAEMANGFNQRALQVRDIVHFRMQTYINALNQTKGLFVANGGKVTRRAFYQYVEGIELFKHYPGIQGLGFTERLAPQDLPAHTARVRQEGFPHYRVWPPTPARDDYFSIVLLEPFDWRNQRAFGYDMFSEPIRRAAMIQARDTGLPAASGRVTLVQETATDRQAGFLIYVPVYRADTAVVTPAQRRAALLGFVYAPFRVNDLFRAAFTNERERDLSSLRVRLYDRPGNDLLYEYTEADRAGSGAHWPLFRRALPLKVAGRTWSVEVELLPALPLLTTLAVPLLILGFGTALSLMSYRIVRDLATQRRMEQELAKARNLESIGLLAGGIAHDFNNILTAILGNISLARMRAPAGGEVHEILIEAEKASTRARDLTQQLLTFAKGGVPIKQTARLDQVLRDTASFALRGSNVRLEFAIADDLWPGEVDSNQISQVINNLALNAKQAMPNGGTLTLAAENRTLAAGKVLGLPAGRYIKIEVRDTGTGIAPRHLDRVFDPYFTTKQDGSGLGLATSYSIVQRHQGHIGVASRAGVGTAFTIYLPAAAQAATAPARSERIATGAGRLLLMDDDTAVRDIGHALLTGLGYTVVAVADGAAALAEYRAAMTQGAAFDAVILDLTVPGGMGGAECMRALLALDSEACGIVSSGYSNDPVMADYERAGFIARVPKPYQLADLAAAVNAALTRRRARTAPGVPTA